MSFLAFCRGLYFYICRNSPFPGVFFQAKVSVFVLKISVEWELLFTLRVRRGCKTWCRKEESAFSHTSNLEVEMNLAAIWWAWKSRWETEGCWSSFGEQGQFPYFVLLLLEEEFSSHPPQLISFMLCSPMLTSERRCRILRWRGSTMREKLRWLLSLQQRQHYEGCTQLKKMKICHLLRLSLLLLKQNSN